MPHDTAIPAPEISPSRPFARSFVPDKRILQREAVGSSALQLPAYGLLAGVAAGWLATMTWGLTRLGRAGIDPTGGPPERGTSRRREVSTPATRAGGLTAS